MRRALLMMVLAAACGPVRPREHAPPPRSMRLGPERTQIPYDDPRAEEKRALFDRINRDRAEHGVPPVQYEPRAALVGDLFCLDGALSGAWGHWDREGRAPYLRWGLAGGVDFHAENAAAWSAGSGMIQDSSAEVLLRSHERMMAETSPNDGHRRTILDPQWTHVGIGAASVGGQYRMTEEFTRVAFDWVEVPAQKVRAGSSVVVAGRPLPGWDVNLVEVRFEPPPRPLSHAEVVKRGSYGYPPTVQTLLPPATDLYQSVSERSDFTVQRGGSVAVRFRLDRGPGYYFVLCYLRRPGGGVELMTPATAAMVTAVD